MLIITYQISCDRCKKIGKKESGIKGMIPKAHILRDLLVSEGWFNDYSSLDLCPKCNENRKKKPANP